jgi:hypothetical protein
MVPTSWTTNSLSLSEELSTTEVSLKWRSVYHTEFRVTFAKFVLDTKGSEMNWKTTEEEVISSIVNLSHRYYTYDKQIGGAWYKSQVGRLTTPLKLTLLAIGARMSQRENWRESSKKKSPRLWLKNFSILRNPSEHCVTVHRWHQSSNSNFSRTELRQKSLF